MKKIFNFAFVLCAMLTLGVGTTVAQTSSPVDN